MCTWCTNNCCRGANEWHEVIDSVRVSAMAIGTNDSHKFMFIVLVLHQTAHAHSGRAQEITEICNHRQTLTTNE